MTQHVRRREKKEKESKLLIQSEGGDSRFCYVNAFSKGEGI